MKTDNSRHLPGQRQVLDKMFADAMLLREVDASLLVQWRKKGLGYAADVVEAFQRQLERARRGN